MKTIQGGIFTIAITLLASAVHSPAIHGLKVSVQGSNAVLSWPSSEYQKFIVQYRPTLKTNDVWVTLTNNMPAAADTNFTMFVHSNSVQFPQITGGAQGTNIFPSPPGFDGMSSQTTADISNMTADQIAVLKEQRKQEAWAALAAMMELLSNTVAQAEADRQAWIAAGRPARVQSTTQSMSTSALDSGASVTTGFYSVEPAIGGTLTVTNGQHLSGVVNISGTTFSQGTSFVSVAVILLDGEIIGAIDDPVSLTNFTFSLDTTLYPSGTHQIQLSLIDSSSEMPDDGAGAAVTDTAPIQMTFDNPIYGVDWTGVVEKRFVAMFGTTITNGQIRIQLTDDLARTWLDETNNLADVRQPDGSIIIQASQEYIYSGVKSFAFQLTVTPSGGGSAVSGAFCLSVNQRPAGNYGYGFSCVQETSVGGLGPHFAASVQEVFNLTGDNTLYAFQTVMDTVDLDGYLNPGYSWTLNPRGDANRNDFNRIRDALKNTVPAPDYPLGITFFSYIGHGWNRHLGWAPSRPSPYNVQNIRARDLKPVGLTRYNTNGVVNFAMLFQCFGAATNSDIMKAMVGTTRGLSYNYYGKHGLWPKFGIGFDGSGKVQKMFLLGIFGRAPYTPVFDFISQWQLEAFLGRNSSNWPTNTFAAAFARAASKGADYQEGSTWFRMVGCTNCYVDEVVSGHIRNTSQQVENLVPSTEENLGGYINVSLSGQQVWIDGPDVR